jgi:nucleotide-binding universal stress UspA family protein
MTNPGFQHILVPLDGTPSSELALGAAQQAVSQAGRLTLVQIAEDLVAPHQLPHDSDKETFWQQQAQPARDYLAGVAKLVWRTDLEVKTLVASGHPATAILDIVADSAVDAVSMCSHTHSKLRQFLLGSTVQTVMRRCPVPVIIVHPSPEREEPS